MMKKERENQTIFREILERMLKDSQGYETGCRADKDREMANVWWGRTDCLYEILALPFLAK